jgi:hypothetical protein
MITQLYIFSPGSYVVADEWNANFRVLRSTNVLHQESIVDANNIILFQGGDYTDVYNRINNDPNSHVAESTIQNPMVDNEYYRVLQGGEQLFVSVDPGTLNGETRIVVQTTQNNALPPVVITYGGTQDNVVWTNGIAQWYLAGVKFVFLLERNGKLYVKMIATE